MSGACRFRRPHRRRQQRRNGEDFLLRNVAFRQRLAAMTADLRPVDLRQFLQVLAGLMEDRFGRRRLFRNLAQCLRSRVQTRPDGFQFILDLFAALLDRRAPRSAILAALLGLMQFLAA